ncbi:MAG: hypothetical protein QOJ63_2811 [Solirubrobacteraceae bacterium]|jgi:hypothetical protein|nr:hypothetical protein [Solirubrobacteraceae bacterium]
MPIPEVTVSGHEQGPSKFEQDPTNRRAEHPPREPTRADPNDPRARAAARLALDRTGPRDPAVVRQERAQRVAPALGRTALSARDEAPDRKQPERPESRD